MPIRIVAVILYSIVFSLNAFAQSSVKPAWVDSMKHSGYTEEKYIQCVGMVKSTGNIAEDTKVADQNAITEIAKQIYSQITAETKINKIEVTNDSQGSLITKTYSNNSIKTSIELNGLSIVERYYDPNTRIFYSLAILDRDIATNKYKNNLVKQQDIFNTNLKESDLKLTQGLVFPALQNLQFAYQAAIEYENNNEFYQLLASHFGKLENELDSIDQPSTTQTIQKVDNIFNNLNVSIINGNNQEYVVDKPLKLPLKIQISLKTDNDIIPVKSFPVKYIFKAGRGDINTSGYTDEEGVSEASIGNINESNDQKFIVSFKLNTSTLISKEPSMLPWNTQISSNVNEKFFQFIPKKISKPQKVLILIDEKNKYNAPMIEQILFQKLQENGFTPIMDNTQKALILEAVSQNKIEYLNNHFGDTYSMIISGNIAPYKLNEVEGMQIYMAKGLIKVISLKQKNLITSTSFPDIKGFGNNDELAESDVLVKSADSIANDVLNAL